MTFGHLYLEKCAEVEQLRAALRREELVTWLLVEGANQMSDATKPCRVCNKEAKLLPAGAYQRDASTWIVFDNQERRGWQCSDPRCAWIFGAPVGTYDADPQFGLKSKDEPPAP